jgi:hypothetical protein
VGCEPGAYRIITCRGTAPPLNWCSGPRLPAAHVMMNAALWAVAAFALAVAVLLFVMGWYSPPTNNWLVHPRIFQWGSRAVEYVPGETALDRTYNYSGAVIIVGAGAAGLAAAKVLESNKIKYVILEATERYGGRVKADTTFADFPIDLAAEWIHNLPGILDVLSGRDNAASPPELVPWLLQESCEWDGRSLKTISTFTNNFAFRVFPEYKFKRSTWYRFVRERFAEKVEHRIQYSSPVAEVDYSKGQVTVTTTTGKRFVADKVIMTASVGVLRSGNIRFVPALSAQRTRALDAVEFKPGFKLVLKFSVKFYPDGINWALPSEDDGERGWYDMAFKKDAKSNVLGFLCTGAGTKPYCENTRTVPACFHRAPLLATYVLCACVFRRHEVR